MSKTRRRPKNIIEKDISRSAVISQRDRRNVKVFRSKGFWFGVAVFLLALLIRGVYLYESGDNPTFRAPIVDSLTYDQMARGMVEGKEMTHEFFWQPVFYPLFLSMVYWLSNSSIFCVKLVQMILGCVTCVLVYRLGEKIFGRRTGILAGVIAAAYMPLVFFEAELLAAGWAAFWSVAAVLVLFNARERASVRGCFILGVCSAFSIITRPVFLLFILGGLVWLVVVWIRERIGIKKLILGLVNVTVGFLVVCGPVAILSYCVVRRVIILPYSGGINFYVGNNPSYKETITVRPGLGWRKLTELPMRYGIEDRYEAQRFFFNQTIDYIVTQPMSFLKGLGYKMAQFLNSREMPRNVDIYLFRKWSGLLRIGVWKAGKFGFPFGVLLPLAVVGGVYWWRRVPGPMWLYMMFYPTSVILVFVTSRYRVPIAGVMSVLAAGGCVAVWKVVQGQRWGKFAVVVAILVGIGLASSITGPFYLEHQLNYEAELYFGLGDSLNKRGRVKEAIEAYSKAVNLKGDYVEAHENLGLILVDQGRFEEAVAHYKAGLKVDPENVDLLNNLGIGLFKQRKIKEAVRYYQEALKLNPKSANVHNNLGNALFRLGKVDGAIQHYSKALDVKPNDASVHSNLGNVLAMSGRLAEAAEHYRISLEIRPRHAKTLSNLGNALLQMGRLKEAQQKYTESLKIDNSNAGTYVNLGICLERQGWIDKAIKEYRKALAIDPGHKQARQALERVSQ